MSSPDVVIVGAGLAGLTAAALLAQEGLEVALIEQEQDVGGKLRILEREGFRLDGGLHCFHYGDAGPLGELDRLLGLGISYLESPNASYILRGKNRLPVPPESGTDPHDVPGFTAAEAQKIRDWFSRLMEADASEWDKKSVAEFLAASGFSDDELIASYAAAQCLTVLGRNISEVSAGLIIAHSKAVGHPGFHVSVIAGGTGKLVAALTEKISRDHVRTLLGNKVVEIKVEAKGVAQVISSSEEFSPAAVIYTAPAQYIPEQLTGDKAAASLARKCKRLTPIAGIALEFGLASRISEIRGVMIDPEEAVIGRFPSNLDPSLAPEGRQIASWLALVSPEDLAEVKEAGSHIKRLRRVALKQFPEMEEQVKFERLRAIHIISAAAPLPTQSLEKRPGVAVKQIKNLFLAGDGASGKGLLSGLAVSSAMEAVERVKKFLAKNQEEPTE